MFLPDGERAERDAHTIGTSAPLAIIQRNLDGSVVHLANVGEIMLTRQILLWVFVVSSLPVSAMAQTSVNAARIEAMMNDIAEGHDKAFTQPVALAWSLNTDHSIAGRIRDINARMAQEIERVAGAFITAPAADKITTTKAVVAQIDPETARDGAAYAFEGSSPSLAFFRQLLFVPAAASVPIRLARSCKSAASSCARPRTTTPITNTAIPPTSSSPRSLS
jgi:hypothetical protein